MSTKKNTNTTETTQPQVEKNAQSGLVVRSSVRAGAAVAAPGWSTKPRR